MQSTQVKKQAAPTSPNRQQQIEERLAQMPPKCRRTYERAVNGSKAAAIKAQCLECCGWVRQEVTLCTDPACPLYAARPFQKGSERAKPLPVHREKSRV